MESSGVLALMCLLLIKHYVADFPLQFPKHYLNKGTYGHWGGIEHALIHGVGTVVATFPFTPVWLGLCLGILDAVVHYHVDWLKMNVSKGQEWSKYIESNATSASSLERVYPDHLAIYSNHYFQAIGLDQLAHHMTYVLVVYMVIR